MAQADTSRELGRPEQGRQSRALIRAYRFLFLCGIVLGFDLGAELEVALSLPASLTLPAGLHLVAEFAAWTGLAVAFVRLRAEVRSLAAGAQADRARLLALRGAFDGLMHKRFTAWGLTPAERDVALLTLRGLKIAEIAEARGVREGTVKAQLSTIFRKSGVATRTEFVALFIDEFLDLGAGPAPSVPA